MSEAYQSTPLVLVIFGITGDLAQRYLLTALYHLAAADELPQSLHIVGVSRRNVNVEAVYAKLADVIGEGYNADVTAKLQKATEMRQMDLDAQVDYESFRDRLTAIEADLPTGAVRLYYLSIPPQAFIPIVHLLGQTGHADLLDGEQLQPRLLVEKPFGFDTSSAKELIDAVNEHYDASQVYRIDHYVAKEMVQNMLTFRFNNPLFEPIWNGSHISNVTVTAYEKLDIQGRADFYEQTGALRDLIQSHLLQLLAITIMDRPAEMNSEAIHATKLAALEAITPIAEDAVLRQTVRGQYEGYREAVQNSNSLIETYAKLTLTSTAASWQNVPLVVQTGKAMAEKLTTISVCFIDRNDPKQVPNKLLFRIQPHEGITVQLQVKRPGIDSDSGPADLDFDYHDGFSGRPADAYERVIVDAIRGDQTLFATDAEVMASWKIIEQVLSVWHRSADGLQTYVSGTDSLK